MIYYYTGVITRQSQGMMLLQAGRRRPRRLSSSSPSSLGRRFIIQQPVQTTVVHVRNIVSTTSSFYSPNNNGVNKDIEKETTTKNISDSQQHQYQHQHQQQHQPQSQSESSILSTTTTKVQNGIDESSLSSSPSLPSSSPSLLVSNELITDTNNGGTGGSSRAAMYYDKAFQFISERSGSSEILQLKESVNHAGLAFDQASAAVTLARRKLDETLRTWERTSGQHMQLLQRRESWTPSDAQQFADLVTTEITSRHELEFCRKNLAQSEESLTRSQLDYINKMRKRYHEENMWQDQWRVIGTYGTWILIGLNSCVFLGSQYNLRLRETERMETIKQLLVLHGNGNGNNNNKIAKENDVMETKQSSSIDTKDIVDTVGVVTNEVEKDRNGGNIIENHADSSEKHDEIEKSIRCDDDEAKEEAVTTTTTTGKETFQNRIQYRIRSDAKHLLSSFQQQIHQIRAAIPPTKIKILEEFPKSVSDINIPSAIIGASITGITMITISIVFSSFSARR